MDYLTHIDGSRDTLLAKFDIDTRRAAATLFIGHRISPDRQLRVRHELDAASQTRIRE